MKSIQTLILALTASIVLGSFFAQAQSAKGMKSMSAPTKEQREEMAKVHEQMATCLRSDKPIQECHEEMMKNHPRMNGMMDNCPMRNKPGMNKMMHKKGAMKGDKGEDSEKTEE